MKPVTIIGIGDDGCSSLTSRAVNAVARAQVLAGGERHHEFFPQFAGERIVFKNGISAAIDRIGEAADENTICILASGDPLFFGVAGLITKKIGADRIEIIPQPSSMQWAFARIGMKWEDAGFISLHGKSREGFLTRLKRHKKIVVFTDNENSPATLARIMSDHGETHWTAHVCENLCGPDERIRRMTIGELADCDDIASLNILILTTDRRVRPALSFLHEDEFAKRMPKKGLITKREVRHLSLGFLEIAPTDVIWDIGAGSGSVSIEAAMLARDGRVYAVEVDPEGVAICHENLQTFAVDNVRVIEGRAPEALATLDDPDAVFIGGSKGSMDEIIAVALDRLKSGGRIVANAITLDNVAEAYRAFKERGITPDVTLINISRGAPLAKYLRYEAQNPIHIFAARKTPLD